ncbi:Hypoxic response protein 1 [Fundidesulfovibrio magnetotacticus]|uniref:Hypoxic response protein 1 n=1 Tax=Fundidesulfovibrio magnetotacticus TaxID=2730080 RepID=A0A6V8LYM2_9BACT|nr:CBS domain-containing protein [Fundidesulfovibrio magnetotacticus]GFK95900.1 Hypoxic response protein 1 [Fundidesulfovibrio magnetotacticus]
MKVKDAMSKRIMFVGKDATAAQAMRIMAENNMRRLMVEVDKAGEIYGAVTVRDMIAKVIAPGLDPTAVRVADIMNVKLVAASPEDSLQDAAKVMEEKNVAGMPVFEGTKLVGVIAMWDILIALGVHGKAS